MGLQLGPPTPYWQAEGGYGVVDEADREAGIEEEQGVQPAEGAASGAAAGSSVGGSAARNLKGEARKAAPGKK
ncbi:hypothetical protein MNEG_12003 [Monoraphidium neglectum]|uniref:Uncharacterized protein n=1 Tax=Monoraphidium neglectum TaxID=145388 RepID=A0A0D2KJF4_9CHLO|nr:hypothetical protein MNEG_12003 [Monoraphidium neglectum]KIY95958.1 hypothetical protein MNEG_12003 [Monoraphidium neglectum]|eukprot:XP_013894978.1 hypothetical protein MNEG_12003 [Monoraphidium neglectum]